MSPIRSQVIYLDNLLINQSGCQPTICMLDTVEQHYWSTKPCIFSFDQVTAVSISFLILSRFRLCRNQIEHYRPVLLDSISYTLHLCVGAISSAVQATAAMSLLHFERRWSYVRFNWHRRTEFGSEQYIGCCAWCIVQPTAWPLFHCAPL